MIHKEIEHSEQIGSRPKAGGRSSHFQHNEPFLEKILSAFRFRMAERLIPPGARVLDLGCGFDGGFLQRIENKITSGVGIDMTVDEKFYDKKIKLLNGNLNDPLPFQNEEFDIVVSLANLEHLEDPQKNLNEIRRVLRLGGKLILTTPSVYAQPVLEFLSYNLHIVSEQEVRDHKNYFNRKKLFHLLNQAGFSSMRHRYFQIFMNNFIYAEK